MCEPLTDAQWDRIREDGERNKPAVDFLLKCLLIVSAAVMAAIGSTALWAYLFPAG